MVVFIESCVRIMEMMNELPNSDARNMIIYPKYIRKMCDTPATKGMSPGD